MLPPAGGDVSDPVAIIAAAPAMPAAAAPPLSPPPNPPEDRPWVNGPGGNVLTRAGKKLGRVYCNPYRANFSFHISCHHPRHVRCEKWQPIDSMPVQDTQLFSEWLYAQKDFSSSDEHLAQWDRIVLGKSEVNPAGPAA